MAHAAASRFFISKRTGLWVFGFGVALLALALALWTVFASLPTVFGFAASPPSWPLCGDAERVVQVAERETRIAVRSECWSAWIRVPPHRNFQVDTPGEVEAWFWNGKRLFFADHNPRWLGDIPTSTFRIRGKTGTAVVHLK